MALKFIITFCLLITVSCSDKTKDNPPEKSITENLPTEETFSQVDQQQESIETPADSAPTYKKEYITQEKYLDAYTSQVIQEVKKRLSAKPASEQTTANIELANRIDSIDFRPSEKSSLSFLTHTKKKFKFVLTGKKNNTEHFSFYDRQGNSLREGSEIYTAEVTLLNPKNLNKKVTVIKINDLVEKSHIYVVHALKKGISKVTYLDGYNYTKELSPTGAVFVEDQIENPEVTGEFYSVITESPNSSNASQFKLTFSDTFQLTSNPIINYYTSEQTHIPMTPDYVSVWGSLTGSAAYTSGRDFAYSIESQRLPEELIAMNIDLKVQAKEKIKGTANFVPLRFFIKFK